MFFFANNPYKFHKKIQCKIYILGKLKRWKTPSWKSAGGKDRKIEKGKIDKKRRGA